MNNELPDYPILLTGGTGFLGIFLAAELLKLGKTIHFLMRPRKQGNEKDFLLKKLEEVGYNPTSYSQVQVILGDITKSFCDIAEDWREAHKNVISSIWHLAGLVQFNNKSELQSINIEGTKNVVDIARQLRAHLYFISTAYVSGVSDEKEIVEDTFEKNPHLRNFYEKSKYEAEKIVREHMAAGELTATIFRPSILIGHSGTGQAYSFTGYYVPLFLFYKLKKFFDRHTYLLRFPMIIPYINGATLNLIPIDYAVRWITLLADQLESQNKTFHIVHPNPPLVRFVFEASLTELGFQKLKFVEVSRRGMNFIRFLLVGISYLCGAFGKRMRLQLGEYIGYLTSDYEFLTFNTECIKKELVDLPPLDGAFFKRCIAYAIKVNFNREYPSPD